MKVMIGAENFFPYTLFNNDDNNKKLVNENYSKCNSVVFMTVNGILANILVLGDAIKSDASITIKYLKQNGMDVYIASGDNDATVQSIASQLNIQSDNVKGSLRPEDKTKLIKNLHSAGKTVVFVGDGFNDSPALTESDIGIAMASGVELSLYSASIVLQSNKLLDITRVCELLKLVKNVIDKNLFFAFLYNTMTIPVASGLFYRYGIVLNPSLCSLLMALSSLSIMISSFNMSHQYEKRIKDNKHLQL
jgi:P-type E1-E2 ATPase